ncbi:unnamed protein product [Spirodela intermedia]|uniref:Uncharacterized protein n=1 Tax=Spirodela intermedia TaxID=51605 RepID=A0A7I8II59_SPIIN|nr:unnamed protein product [Spirodela intermedia]CAA6657563.1 unnamed protein product [Spirodela intermedia]
MNWVSRKIHLYNVTMGLYMLDWWERYLFNILMAVLLWFICYNTWHSHTYAYSSYPWWYFKKSRGVRKYLDNSKTS